MDESAKTEARNYLSAAGFFLLATAFLLMVFGNIGSSTFVKSNDHLNIALGIGLLIVATLLIVLRKRDMIAILIFMMGFYQLFAAFALPGTWSTILLGFLLLVALVTLTSKDKQKWLLFLVPAIWFVRDIIWMCCGYNLAVYVVFNAVLVVICLYYALTCASERLSIPGRKLLTADEATDFKASGSVLGYMLFAIISGGYALHYLLGEAALPFVTFQTMEPLCGALMVFVAILLLTVGKMRFTPIMFLLIALTNVLLLYSSGAMVIGLGGLIIIIGLFAILRKESRILPGIMLAIYGCAFFVCTYFTGGDSLSQIASVLLNGIPALIAIYLSFVVYSQRKLPKF